MMEGVIPAIQCCPEYDMHAHVHTRTYTDTHDTIIIKGTAAPGAREMSQ